MIARGCGLETRATGDAVPPSPRTPGVGVAPRNCGLQTRDTGDAVPPSPRTPGVGVAPRGCGLETRVTGDAVPPSPRTPGVGVPPRNCGLQTRVSAPAAAGAGVAGGHEIKKSRGQKKTSQATGCKPALLLEKRKAMLIRFWHHGFCRFTAIVALLLSVASAFGGVVVTQSRQVRFGRVFIEENRLACETEFGSIKLTREQVAWYSSSDAIDSLLEAGYAAEQDGRKNVALFLYIQSGKKEPETSAKARQALRLLQGDGKPRESQTGNVSKEDASKKDTATSQEQKTNVILDEVAKDLVRLNDHGRTVRVKGDDAPDVEMYAIYFSAHWCPPCRAFTPKLVSFYKENKAAHADKFDIVFVSRDHSDDDMEEYMKEANMPWYAIKHDAIKQCDLNRYAGSGIPCLVLVDREGNILSDSYQDGRYVGPTHVMNALRDRL
jgi:nucleoredoxin